MTAEMINARNEISEWQAAGPTVRQRSDDLLDLQNRCWHEGRPSPIELFLENDRELSSNSEIVLDLIYNEVRLREASGETPDLEEYGRRFPALKEMLDVQFEVHRAMGPGQLLPEMSTTEDSLESQWAARPLPSTPGYDVLAELGRGAMGVVYKARHLRLNRLVALKMILAGDHAGPRERARFESEALAIARLHHPHIVQIYEVGEHEGRPFVCLELASGGNLAQRLQKDPVAPAAAAALIEMLARAVQYAHDQQIVHRDLKPGNILLVRSDARRGVLLGGTGTPAYFEPKIADFGLAKLLDDQQNSEGQASAPVTGRPVGTPPYMAPEQARRSLERICKAILQKTVASATFLRPSAAVLYELLTGRPPFLGSTVIDTLQQVVSREPLAPRRLQPAVPSDLEIVSLACLRKEPQRRYASALALAEDLRRYLDGMPIQQKPPALWEPALKWAKRRPAAASFTKAAAGHLGVGLGLAASLVLVWGSIYLSSHRAEWARTRTRERYRQFGENRDAAIFEGSLLTAQPDAQPDLQSIDAEAIAVSVKRALVLAGMDGLAESELARDPNLSRAERAELAKDYYELMLTLARAMGYSLPSTGVDLRRHKAEEGLRYLEQISKADRNSKAFHQTRSDLLRALGDVGGADEELHQAEGLQPSTASDFFFVGLNQFGAGESAKAISSFDRTLRLQPNHFEAQCFRARVSLDLGRTNEAIVGLTACIAQKPTSAWAYLLRGAALIDERSFDEALSDLAMAAKLDQGNLVQYMVTAHRGRLWLRRENLEKALAELTAAAKLRPNECQAHFQLARSYEGLKRYADADREMDEAMRLRPDLALIPRQHGWMRSERRQQEAALEDFRAAIKLALANGKDPELADDYMRCGGIKNTQGRFAEAVAEYDSALRIRPDDALAHHLRGESLLSLDRFEEAERAFDRSLEIKPGYGPALRARGQTRVQLADYSGARAGLFTGCGNRTRRQHPHASGLGLFLL